MPLPVILFTTTTTRPPSGLLKVTDSVPPEASFVLEAIKSGSPEVDGMAENTIRSKSAPDGFCTVMVPSLPSPKSKVPAHTALSVSELPKEADQDPSPSGRKSAAAAASFFT